MDLLEGSFTNGSPSSGITYWNEWEELGEWVLPPNAGHYITSLALPD